VKGQDRTEEADESEVEEVGKAEELDTRARTDSEQKEIIVPQLQNFRR
jgi:hypothetical protein